jgi:hypothetical protein
MSYSVFLGRPLQLNLMFVDNARSVNLSGALERRFTQVGSGLAHKH